MNESTKPRGRRWLKPVLALLALAGVVLVLEGALSLGAMIRAVSENARPLPAAHRFMSHDSVLGWTAESGVRDANAYGEWHPLTTNGAGLRRSGTVAQEPPGGRFRILCAGGSGVFGVNVADQENWCARLEGAGPAIETVNAGQPAYGPGQSWLLLRDRLSFRHDLLLFAIDGSDMFKLLANDHAGFPKPRLHPGESGLEVANTPIPGRAFWWPWVTFNASHFSQSHLLSPLLYRAPGADMRNPAMGATVIMSNLVPELEALAESRGAQLAVVFLPTHPAFRDRTRMWRESMANQLQIRGIPLVDLADGAGAAPAELFDREGQLTAQAHQSVAAALTRELVAMESVEVPSLEGGPWRVRYYADAVFQAVAGVESHAVSALYWGENAPLADMPSDGFSVLMESCLPLEEPRRVRVRLEADGPATFSVNDQTVLDTGEGEGPLFRVNAVDLPAGDNRLRVRYRDSAGRAAVRLLFRFEDGTVITPGRSVLEAPGSGGCGG